MTSEYVSGSLRIASTTTFLNPPAPSIPPSKTTAIAENKQELSSGTLRNSNDPASPGNSILAPSSFPPPFAGLLLAPLPVLVLVEGAAAGVEA